MPVLEIISFTHEIHTHVLIHYKFFYSDKCFYSIPIIAFKKFFSCLVCYFFMAGGGWRVWELSQKPSMSLALNCIWSHQHHSKSSLLAHTVGRHTDRGLHTVSGDRTGGEHRWWTQPPTAAGPQIQTWTLVAVRDPDIAMAAQSTCVNMALVAPRPSDINTASDGCTAFGSNTSHESQHRPRLQ